MGIFNNAPYQTIVHINNKILSSFKASNNMKKIFLFSLVSAIIVFVACSKEGKETSENTCPVLAASAVPLVVKDSFTLRYPAITVTTWFNKDSVAYCAYFVAATGNKLVQFANNGTFIKEEIEVYQEGQHEDSTNTSTGGKTPTTGCECEIHKEHD